MDGPRPPAGATLLWTGGTRARQWLERTDALIAPDWQPVWTNPPPTPVTNSLPLPADGFYRLRAVR